MTELDGQTHDFHYTRLLLDFYKAVRMNGDLWILLEKNADFTGYKLVIIPSFVHFQERGLTKSD